MQQGKLFVISAPSGAGKTTLVKRVILARPELKFSISYTTRPARPGEQDRIDYFFLDRNEFKQMHDEGAFLEHAEVFGNFYGTGKQQVTTLCAAGNDVLLEIDWQGTAQIRLEVPHATTIFILPPSLGSLRDRLQQRAQDDQHTVDQRMSAAIDEISHYMDFDYLIVNDDFDQALSEMGAVVSGQGDHLRQAAQRRKLAPLISALQG